MQKRGQITVFIIIGIIIIAVFGFIFYISKEVSRIQLETEANRIIDSVLATTPLNYYVTLCVEESTKEALNIVGDQGGPINISERPVVSFEGKGINFERAESQVPYDVAYSITRWNETDLQGMPYLYPCNSRMEESYEYDIFNESLRTPQECEIEPETCKSTLYLDPISYWDVPPAFCKYKNSMSKFPYLPEIEYGKSDYIIPLCKPEHCKTDLLKVEIPFTINKKTLPIYAGEGIDNIQEQMEVLIADLVDQCVNFQEVEAFTTVLNITRYEVDVNVTMAETGIEVVANFPLTIRIQDYEPVVRILQFSSFVPVRLKPIYKLARYLVEKENSDLDFSIEEDWAQSPYYNPDFVLWKEETASGDRIIRITDTNPGHFLRNGNFTYQFAIQNRQPALDYISQNPGGNYDIIVVEDQTITIRPNATDPDGHSVTYSYTGWKATWNETFTGGEECRDNPENCMEYVPLRKNEWQTSELWGETLSAANYTARHHDIGPHNLTVCASDGFLKDCQTIRILVDDIFEVEAHKDVCDEFISDGFPEDISSFEDPLCLRAEVIDYFSTGDVEYEWYITGIGRNIYSDSEPDIILPRDFQENGEAYHQIYSITDYNITKFFLDKLSDSINVNPGTYGLRLKVIKNRWTDVETEAEAYIEDVKFYECLPHAGTEPPFPFNNLDNQYGADHTCCLGDELQNDDPPAPEEDVWGKYLESGTVCYAGEQHKKLYGCYDSVFESTQPIPSMLSSEKVAIINGNKLANPTFELSDLDGAYEGYKNDVFIRYLNGTCSGTRGNTCTGTVFEVREEVWGCPGDLVESSGQTERCGGCKAEPHSPFNSEISCDLGPDYSLQGQGWTFESGTGGVCNPEQRCVPEIGPNTYGIYDFNTEYQFACKGVCDGEGNCDATIEAQCDDCYLPVKQMICTEQDTDPQNSVQGYPAGANIKEKSTLSAMTGGCQESLGAECAQISVSKTDMCGAGDYQIIEYYYDVFSSYPIKRNYKEGIFNCWQSLPDEQAKITTNAAGMDVCTPGKVSKCNDGACGALELTGSPVTEYCDLGSQQYFAVETYDKNNNGYVDSCKYKPSAVITQSICTNECKAEWDSGTGKCISS